jgi:uncharacterized protein YcfJ
MKSGELAAASLASLLLVQACAGQITRNPDARPSLVDPARTDMAAYQRDYRDCVALANQTDAAQAAENSAAAGAVAGALLGAVIGAVIGHAFDDAAAGARYGAALGGLDGGLGGAAGAYGAARVDQETALRNCLKGRGYNLIR